MNKAFLAVLEHIDTLTRWLVIVCMASMIGVVSVQVLLRYGFAESLDWAEEVSRLAFVWAVFMAIPHGVKLGAHVGIDAAFKHFPAATKAPVQVLLRIASAVLMGIVSVQAGMAAHDNWDQLMPTLNLSSSWFYLAVTVGCAHSACHLVAQVLSGRGLVQPTQVEVAE